MPGDVKRFVAVVALACAGVAEGVTDLVIVSPPDLRAAWEVYAARRRAARPDLGIAVTGTDAGSWLGRFKTPGRQQVALAFAADRTILCVRVRPAATVLCIR